MGGWALCFGAYGLKIKLWATAEYVGVWMTHNHGAIHVIAFIQSHNKKKYDPDRHQPASPTSPKSSPKIVYLKVGQHCSLKASASQSFKDFPKKTNNQSCSSLMLKRETSHFHSPVLHSPAPHRGTTKLLDGALLAAQTCDISSLTTVALFTTCSTMCLSDTYLGVCTHNN